MPNQHIKDLPLQALTAGKAFETDDGTTTGGSRFEPSSVIVQFLNATTAAGARSAIAGVGTMVNVLDYGAVGNGTTNDRTGCQNAISAAAAMATAERPWTVLFPQGYTFALGSSLTLANHVRILIEGTIVRQNAATATTVFSLFTANALVDVRIDGGNLMGTAWGVGIDRRQAASITDVSSLGGRDSFLDCRDCTGQISVTGMVLNRFVNAILIGSECPDNYIVGNRIDSKSPKTLASIDDGTFTPYGAPTGDPGAGIRILGERGGIQVMADAQRNIISNNVIIAVGLDICVDLGSQSHNRVHALVTGNYLAGADGSGLQNYSANGAPFTDSGTLPGTDRRNQWHNNTIMWCRTQGMYIRQVGAVQAHNNYIYRCATVGTFAGTSCGGIQVRGPTPAAYDKSPLANDHWVSLEGNWVVDCGNPTTGEIDASVRLDTWQVRFVNNTVIRTKERFGANRYATNSYGVRTTELSITTTITGTGTTNGTNSLVMTAGLGMMPGNRITISGETGEFEILQFNQGTLTATLNRVCATSGAGRTVTVVAASFRCNMRALEWANNTIIGHRFGVHLNFTNWSRQPIGKLNMSGGYIEAETPLFIDIRQAGPNISDMTLRCEGGAYAFYVRNSPYTSLSRVRMFGGTHSVHLADGCTAADYWQNGGRIGATLRFKDCEFNEFATASFTVQNTATGDINIISRCASCDGNLENGFANQPNSTLAVDGAPGATGSNGGYRIYRVGERMPRRTPAASTTPGYVCTAQGSFGAVIPGTVTTTAASTQVVFTSLSGIVPGVSITIAGVAGTKVVTAIDVPTLTATVDIACDASVAGVTPAHSNPVFKAEANLAA